MDYPTFWMEASDRCCVAIGRYTNRDARTCPNLPGSGCRAELLILTDEPWSDWEEMRDAGGLLEGTMVLTQVRDIPASDPRWLMVCERCGYVFTEQDERWTRISLLYDGSPDGVRRPEKDFMIGALYDKEYLHDWPEWTGSDGISLHCMTPGGPWCIDSIASNCTDPHNVNHKCWIRHGNPRTDPITVDKGGAPTCTAGGGSIQCGNYHGFLRNGKLVQA